MCLHLHMCTHIDAYTDTLLKDHIDKGQLLTHSLSVIKSY